MSKHDMRDDRPKDRKRKKDKKAGKATSGARRAADTPAREAATMPDPVRRATGPRSALAVVAGAVLVALATAALRLRR